MYITAHFGIIFVSVLHMFHLVFSLIYAKECVWH